MSTLGDRHPSLSVCVRGVRALARKVDERVAWGELTLRPAFRRSRARAEAAFELHVAQAMNVARATPTLQVVHAMSLTRSSRG